MKLDNMFENKWMQKIQQFGEKIGQNDFLSSLQGGMMALMAVIMVGAVSQIITGLLSTFGILTSESEIYQFLYMPYNYTMNLLSLWLVMIMAFNYAGRMKLHPPVMSALNSAVCFLIAVHAITPTENGMFLDTSNLGAMGMFAGFVVVFITVRVEKLCVDKNITIKMPASCPPALVSGFSAIIPLLINVFLFWGLHNIISITTGGAYNLSTGMMALLAAPLSAANSIPGVMFLGLFTCLLWCFGIHGAIIVYPIIGPMLFQAAATNAALHAAGQPLEFSPILLYGTISMLGGAGNTLPLCVFGFNSKSEQIQAVSRAAIIPGWFGINEPVTFGMPIMYNPILCIPYVLNVPLIMMLYYLGYQLGILTPAFISIQALMPMGFGSYFATLNIWNGLWAYLCFIPVALLYYPFFKVYEKQLVAQEEKARLEAENPGWQDDLSADIVD